jgi:hypothetical protein
MRSATRRSPANSDLYEDAMLRHRGALTATQVGDIIDYVCSVARQERVFFLCARSCGIPKMTWSPRLRSRPEQMRSLRTIDAILSRSRGSA